MIGTNREKFLPGKRRMLLEHIKREGEATIAELATRVDTTKEAVRQHLVQLEEEGWIRSVPVTGGTPGRPTHAYRLTPVGDHLFVKHYDTLALQLITLIAEKEGKEGIRQVLTDITDRQVREWEDRMRGKSLAERLEMLKGLYFEEDPYTEVERDEEGLVLIERNCPYYNIAMEYPTLCSVTVSTLSRLLGVQVKREKRFQAGDHRCAFRVLSDRPLNREDFRFAFEEETEDESRSD